MNICSSLTACTGCHRAPGWMQALPLAFRRTPWTEDERKRLREAVLQMVQVGSQVES